MKRLLVPLVILTGCAAPQVDYKRAAQYPYAPHLVDKAAALEAEAVDQIDLTTGLFAHRWYDPTSDYFDERRYHLADGIAWHGYLMAALALEAAVLTRDVDPTDLLAVAAVDAKVIDIGDALLRMAGYFELSYNATGQDGLICRSMLPDLYDSNVPLAFMNHGNPHYRWVAFPDGAKFRWCLAQPNKDHVNMAGVGLSVVLAVDAAQGGLFDASVTTAVRDALVPLVQRLVADDYLVLDHSDRPTQFPSFEPSWGALPEGFNRISALQLLAAAAAHGGDASLETEYENRLEEWGTGYAWALHWVGRWTRYVGHWNRWATVGYSDMQALALGAFSFLLNEDRSPYKDEVKDGLRAGWRFMKYEPHGIYWPIYLHYVDSSESAPRMKMVIDELMSIPLARENRLGRRKRTPGKVQPIHNRPVDGNYWKADPYERHDPGPYSGQRLAGMDYLLSYWLGRYLRLITASPDGL